jgi:hypothetical protein
MVKVETAVPGFWFPTFIVEIVPAPDASELSVSFLPAFTPATSTWLSVVPGTTLGAAPDQSVLVSQTASATMLKIVAPWSDEAEKRGESQRVDGVL